MTDSTLHLKNKRKEKTPDAPLEVPKHEKADLHERRPPKKPKDFKLQYRGKPGTVVAVSHKEWHHLDVYHTLEQAQAWEAQVRAVALPLGVVWPSAPTSRSGSGSAWPWVLEAGWRSDRRCTTLTRSRAAA